MLLLLSERDGGGGGTKKTKGQKEHRERESGTKTEFAL